MVKNLHLYQCARVKSTSFIFALMRLIPLKEASLKFSRLHIRLILPWHPYWLPPYVLRCRWFSTLYYSSYFSRKNSQGKYD
jgi:hypothetical protein